MGNRIITVGQLNKYIKSIMDNNSALKNIFIKGEISNFKHHYSGHMYFTLKDEKGTIKAIMFKGANQRLSFLPESGMKVIAEGRVTVFERDGVYQLYVENMQPDGIGALYLAFEQMKKKLEKEGLFDKSRKKMIPYVPKSIGVVTSSTGAAIKDILHVLKRRFPYSNVLIYPVLVQGRLASKEIVEGIRYFNEVNNVDVIITGRGGGSIEDLWPFNEEIVARCIADSNIPIISAVGHETDFTISDYVADMRAPTPSAAAEIAVPSRDELLDRLIMTQRQIYFLIKKHIENKRGRLNILMQSQVFKYPLDNIEQKRIVIDKFTKDMSNSITYKINISKEKFTAICGKLHTLSPLAVLSRGYAVAKAHHGQIITSVEDVKVKDSIDVSVTDGIINCKVEGREYGKVNEF